MVSLTAVIALLDFVVFRSRPFVYSVVHQCSCLAPVLACVIVTANLCRQLGEFLCEFKCLAQFVALVDVLIAVDFVP